MFRVTLFLVIALLTACSQTSELQRPVPPVPYAWPEGAVKVDKADAQKTHWRAFFTDPRLQALINAALENNRDLRIAVARVAEARAQYGMARAEKLPSVYWGPDVRTSIVSVSYELDFWGRVSGMSESARASVLASEESKRVVILSLVADVAGAYFTILQLDELIALTQTTVTLRQESLDLFSKGRDLGGIQEYEVQQASSILEATRSGLSSLEYQRAAASNRIRYLVGHAPDVLPPGRALDAQGLDADLAPGLPADVLLLRPDVMASEQRLRAAHANIGVARTAFFPKIMLTAGLGVASQGLSSVFNSGFWSLNPTAALPAIFDGGRTMAGVDVAEARKEVALAEYEKVIQQAFREVADLLFAKASIESQLRASLASTRAQEARLKIAQARYNAGFVTYLEVLDAQREVLAAQQGQIQLRRAQLESAAQLYKALGGGDPSVN
jgi:outer membrane protein, multidrug efflux system